MNEAFFGAIADDFTGATDLAAMLARAGVPVTLRIGVPEAGTRATAFEVVALKIRTLPPEEAVAQARAALRWLQGAGVRHVFWKYCSTFDSTPRGNIGPVAEMLMGALGAPRTVHVPAFPENGRRVFMGHLFVGALPLHESSMRDHPLTPMRDSSLQRLLKPQTTRGTALVDWPTVRQGAAAVRAAVEAEAGHVVLDAVDDADLAVLAEAIHAMPLVCGGSAVALPIARHLRDAVPEATVPPLPVPGPGRLVLSGSCSEMTRRQVADYLRRAEGYRLDPVELSRGGLADARHWLEQQDPASGPIVYATAEPHAVARAQEVLGVARAGALVEKALATLAADAAGRGVGAIVVAGGETSGAVTTALGVTRLRIGPEIAPGVPWCFAAGGPALALKSGNFGEAGFFSDAFAMLEGGAVAAQ
ncbi:3-oxo-tetronate kinase [Jannaschia sp. W003]|uniref:3-oxo-tetronate kinase n=1 Tax=Jannaschia sp. W003 TaxID=2867012 RepID=UPI0021A819E3|nr:3-oxo-tetronate kinase [Jannaschia sp. W003]UWQ20773.1 four-carbon acid sugar kinase family protein [Jannaschia sp. W003]